MSSLRNAIPKRAYKERAQPHSRRKFGLLEKHKDYVIRAREYHKKEESLRRLKEKAANRNPDEFYFRMIRTKTVNGVHRPESEANKYTPEELMLMKTQDIGYVLQKIQSEKKKVEKLKAMLHSLDNQPANKHIYYAEDRSLQSANIDALTISCGRAPLSSLTSHGSRVLAANLPDGNILLFQETWPTTDDEEANEISSSLKDREQHKLGSMPDVIKRKMDASYRDLEARMKRVQDLERVYDEMALQKELQKKGKKRKLREEELVCPTDRPVYKWRAERKR